MTEQQTEELRQYVLATGAGAVTAAGYLGLSPSVVTRALRRLRDDGKLPPRSSGSHAPDDYRQAIAAEDPPEVADRPAVDIDGLTPADHQPDGSAILDRLIGEQEHVESRVARKYSQRIEIRDSGPVVLALLSDMHLGNTYTDYRAFRDDVEAVAACPWCYALTAGDMHDNWIGKLEGMQRWQKCDFDAELAMLDWLFERLDGSLLAVLAGNHENRTRKIAGTDTIRLLLRGARLLYDRHEILFTLKLGAAEWRVKARHRWKGASVFNPTHGIEVDLQRGDSDWDIGIGAHTHKGTMFREFVNRSNYKLAALLGTYKLYDGYGAELGYARSVGRGCGAIVFRPDGRYQAYRDLAEAVDFAGWLRKGGGA